jgi:hypothetical protein
MSPIKIDDPQAHEEITAMLPWYVNATLNSADRQRVDAHLSVCATCREDLAFEGRVFEGVRAQTAIEYIPVASLNRLRARLDTNPVVSTGMPMTSQPRRRRHLLAWRGMLAASVAIMALAVALLAADRWMQYRSQSAAHYYTVTSAAPRVPDEAIRAVFSPSITLVELQRVLDESHVRIVSGPTEAGVYSLALTTERPVNESLAILRQHPTVRFAESSLPDTPR